MGIVFGATGSKEPAFTMLLKAAPYEIRSYPQYFIAEVSMDGTEGPDAAFRTLAKYIGVFGKPENEGSKSLAMTAPVITEPKQIAMTAPVITTEKGAEYPEKNMQFVLPFEYTKIEDVPKPTNDRVSIKAIPGKIVAVSKFSGWYDPKTGRSMAESLLKNLFQDAFVTEVNYSKGLDAQKWCVAQYHPPFTLPFLRRNEIWIEMEPASCEKLNALILAKSTADRLDKKENGEKVDNVQIG